MRADASAGRTRTWCASSPRLGSTSPDGPSDAVISSNLLMCTPLAGVDPSAARVRIAPEVGMTSPDPDVPNPVMGLVLLVVVLGAATVFGLWRQRTDGRMRAVAHAGIDHGAGDSERESTGGGSLPGALSGSSRTPSGRSDEASHSLADVTDSSTEVALDADDVSEPLVVGGAELGPTDHLLMPAANVLTAPDVGSELGERATLVQFSSAFCQPCRVTRAVLADVAQTVPGVTHVEIDAESHLDLVRRVDVTRTPTVLVLDSAGRIRTRAVGAPRPRDVLGALDAIL